MKKLKMRNLILVDVKHLLKKDIIIIQNLPKINNPSNSLNTFF